MPPLPGPTSSSKSLRRALNSRASRGDDRADCATTKRRLAMTERDCFCGLDRLLESTRFDARTGADARRSARRDRAIARTRVDARSSTPRSRERTRARANARHSRRSRVVNNVAFFARARRFARRATSSARERARHASMTASRARRRALDARRAERAPSSRVMSRIAARGDARAASHTRVCAPSHKALGDALYERRVGAPPRRARSRPSACERGVRKRDGCGRVARGVRADARARDATTRARMYDDRFATLARRAGRRACASRGRALERDARGDREDETSLERARASNARARSAPNAQRAVSRARGRSTCRSPRAR